MSTTSIYQVVDELKKLISFFLEDKNYVAAETTLRQMVSVLKPIQTEQKAKDEAKNIGKMLGVISKIKQIVDVKPLPPPPPPTTTTGEKMVVATSGSDTITNQGTDQKKSLIPTPMKQTDLITMDQILGAEREKADIFRDFIAPLNFPDVFQQSKAMLMYGPPGTGKTFFAKAITSEFNKLLQTEGENKVLVHLFAASGAELKGKYIGETEKNIKKYFEAAENIANANGDARAMSILFLDEVEAIALSRENDKNSIASVAALLQYMDGIAAYKKVIVIAATNKELQKEISKG